MTNKRKRIEDTAEGIEEIQDGPEDDLSEWSEGFVDEGRIYVYKIDEGERIFCGKVVPPITPELLQSKFGGGKYEIVAYLPQEDGKKVSIAGKRRITVAGPSAPESPPQQINIAPPVSPANQVKDIIEFYRTIRSLEERRDETDKAKQQVELIGMVQMTMSQMLTQQMQMMQEFQKMMSELREKNTETAANNIGEVVLGVVKEVSGAVQAYLNARGPAVQSLPAPSDVRKEDNDMRTLIEHINSKSRKGPDEEDFRLIAETLDDMGIIEQVPEIGFDNLMNLMKLNGLIVSEDRMPYLKGLYDHIVAYLNEADEDSK